MSVLTHLQATAARALLSADEGSSIQTSISTIGSRLNAHFEKDISSHFRFGSSTRGTILPRKIDEHSDIDYMIVFAKNDAKPQTYLDRVKRFADTYYSSSETKQSHPSVVLELNHIKFDLVPATKTIWDTLQIPDRSSSWQSTDPTGFSSELEEANKRHNSLLKPTIRVLKYWNALRGYPFESFSLEKWAAKLGYIFQTNLRDYVFYAFEQFNPWTEAQWVKDEIERAQKVVTEVKQLERDQYPALAESAVKKLLPEIP
jgi:hypothetical protein